MATLTQAELEKILQTVQTKAATDPQFRQQVLTDPNAAIQAVSGKAAPEGLTLHVIEADPAADMTIVVPPRQTDALSDQELDSVAGGRCYCQLLYRQVECPRDCSPSYCYCIVLYKRVVCTMY